MPIQPNSSHQYYAAPMAKYKGVNVNLKQVPKVKSSDKWYNDREKRKVLYVLCGSLACVLIIGAVFAIPITLTILLNKTTTTTTTNSTPSTTVLTTATSSSNSSNMTNTTPTTTIMNGTTTTTDTTTTTTACLNMTCTFSSIASPMTLTYGVEHLDFNCSHSLSNMTIEIIVQRTVNATYANQYETFWNLTTNQTYIETNTQIIYTWTILPGQTIRDIGFPYFVEGQYTLPNINQTTNLDTYSATFTSVCGDTITHSGTF